MTIGSGLSSSEVSHPATPHPDLFDEMAGWVKIDEVVLAADGLGLDFQDIPQGFRSIRLEARLRSLVAATDLSAIVHHVNNDQTDANYHLQRINSSAAVATAAEVLPAAPTNVRYIGLAPSVNASAEYWAQLEMKFPGYSDTDCYKTYMAENILAYKATTGGSAVRHTVMTHRSTDPITRVTLVPVSGNWKAGSRASLWGVRSPFV